MLNAADSSDLNNVAEKSSASRRRSAVSLPSGLTTQVLLTVIGAVLATIVTLGVIIYSTLSVRLITQQKELLWHNAQFAALQFSAFLQTARTDTLLLADQVRRQGLLKGQEDEFAAEYADQWRAVLLTKPNYAGIRILSADGRTLLHLQRKAARIVSLPPTAGDHSTDLADTERSLSLESDTVWLSDVEHNKDTGRATFRAITTLTPETAERPATTLVIYIETHNVLQLLTPNLASVYPGEVEILVVNGANAFIAHPDHRKTIGPGASTPWRLSDEFPDSDATRDPEQTTSLLRASNAAGTSMLVASSAAGMNAAQPGSIRFMVALPYMAVLVDALPALKDHLLLLLVVALVVLAAHLLGKRILVRPLRQITAAIREAAHADTMSNLPVWRDDEIGELARSFRELFLERLTAQHKTQELALALEHAAAGMVILGPDKLIRYVNPQYERQIGYSRSELVGNLPERGLDNPGFYEDLWQTLDAGNKWSGRLSSRCADGSTLHEQTTIAPIIDAKGAVCGYVATLLDVTALHATEERLRYLAAAIDSTDECIQILSLDNTVIYTNPAYEKQRSVMLKDIFGGASPETSGPQTCNDATLSDMRAAVSRGAPWRGTLKSADHNGALLNEDVSISPIRDHMGTVSAYLIIKRDISQQLNMEQQLLRAQKLEAVGQLAAGIAHEINTPTQYVGDNIRFLKDSFEAVAAFIASINKLGSTATDGKVLMDDLIGALNAVDAEYLLAEIPTAIEQSIDGVERVSKIVRAMKDFSHPATERTPLDINRAISSTATVASNEWKYVAELQTDFDIDLPAVPVMPGDFNQVILNMVVNAAHAIGDVVGDGGNGRGLITLSTRRVDHEAEIRISDTGCGMTPETAARIFDPFFTTKAVGKGTGQGLAMAHNVIVVRHGGTIKVESAPGTGTTFIIRLPLNVPDTGARADDDTQAA